jgi:hypothetical protein
MSVSGHNADDLASVVRYALETTRATAVCPFHPKVTIRVGDDAAETHTFIRAHRMVKSDSPHGSGRFCSKKLSANSTMQQMVFARIVRVRVLKVRSPVAVATVDVCW